MISIHSWDADTSDEADTADQLKTALTTLIAQVTNSNAKLAEAQRLLQEQKAQEEKDRTREKKARLEQNVREQARMDIETKRLASLAAKAPHNDEEAVDLVKKKKARLAAEHEKIRADIQKAEEAKRLELAAQAKQKDIADMPVIVASHVKKWSALFGITSIKVPFQHMVVQHDSLLAADDLSGNSGNRLVKSMLDNIQTLRGLEQV